jgi:hypothetical protein
VSTGVGSPRVKGGFVLVDRESGSILRVVSFQYNPPQLVHTIGVLPGPAESTIELTAELDAAEPAALGDQRSESTGIAARLAALRSVAAAPPPPGNPMVLFVWGKARVLPTQVRAMTVTEHAFDNHLNPVRATVSITLGALTAEDAGPRAASFAEKHELEQQRLADIAGETVAALGVDGIA